MTWAFSTITVSSRARNKGMVVTAMHPALSTANQARAKSGLFSPRNKIRLPVGKRQSSRITRANWLTRANNCP